MNPRSEVAIGYKQQPSISDFRQVALVGMILLRHPDPVYAQ